MSNSHEDISKLTKKEFETWLINDLNLSDREARMHCNSIVLLESFATRRQFKIMRLFSASITEIDLFLSEFYEKMSNDKKGDRLIESVVFLKKYAEHVGNIEQPKKNVQIKKNVPDAMEYSAAKSKTPEGKLIRRLNREFKKCKYIGDIQITDEEYDILKVFFKNGYSNICQKYDHSVISISFAVALVQIGIRFYDGKFWPHIRQELGVEKLDGVHQNWIGTSFYKTLLHYGKFHVDENEFVNNILLHCFITKHYADELFDFLFAYYQIDLDRDLNRNNTDMRNFLLQSMSKSEVSARTYKIKKHTADAVSFNEIGCKIRIGRILRFMDNALFNDIYPTESKNRISQLFCAWAKSSKRFDVEKKHVRGLSRKGVKRFSTPYLHFDYTGACFKLVLPSQYVRLDDEEELPEITWRIHISDKQFTVDVGTESSVTGCKTEKLDNIVFPKENIFDEIDIELWKNDTDRVQRFKLKADSVRFFDKDWDIVDSVAFTKYLPVGQLFAFTEPNEVLVSNSDSIVGFEKILGFGLYILDLKKGDILRLPDGKAKSVGKPLEEGILTQSIVPGSYAIKENTKYSIYNDTPSIYFRMKPSQEQGTFIVINFEKHRFDIEKCVRFDVDEETDEKGYVLSLQGLVEGDGFYEIFIDIPNSRKERYYSFALICGFDFEYDSAPYIFKKCGKLKFNEQLKITSSDENVISVGNTFDFTISPDQDYLKFVSGNSNNNIDIRVYLPAFKWKFDNGEWQIDKPQTIWHKEFPKMIWLKFPDDELTFSMTPIIQSESDEEDDDIFCAEFFKNKEQHMFCCDTRKMFSWFGYEEALRVLYVEFASHKIDFATIVTRCQVNKAEIIEDSNNGELVFKTNISGYIDCFADIYYENELLAEKCLVTTKGIHLQIPFRSGNYKIVYYEWDDEDGDEFGFADYKKFDIKTLQYENKNDLRNKAFYVVSAARDKKKDSIFASSQYALKTPIKIFGVRCIEKDFSKYSGYCVFEEKR